MDTDCEYKSYHNSGINIIETNKCKLVSLARKIGSLRNGS